MHAFISALLYKFEYRSKEFVTAVITLGAALAAVYYRIGFFVIIFAGLLAFISLAQSKFGNGKEVFTLPYEIDLDIATVKLESLGIEIDKLTEEQIAYITAYDEGT